MEEKGKNGMERKKEQKKEKPKKERDGYQNLAACCNIMGFSFVAA